MTDKPNNEVFYGYGDEAYQEEAKRQEKLAKEREANRVASLKTFSMSLKEGENKNIVFLHTKLMIVHVHEFKTYKNGKEVFETLFCLNKETHDCPKCKEGDAPKAKILCAVFDLSPWEDSKGVRFTAGTIKPYLRPFGDGQKIIRLFDGSLTGEVIEDSEVMSKVFRVIRDGSGTSTSYSYYPANAIKMTEEQRKRLKEFLEKYPKPQEYLVRWVQEKYKEVSQTLGVVHEQPTELPTQETPTDSGSHQAVQSDDLPF